MSSALAAFNAWESRNLGQTAEEWLKALYTDKDYSLAEMVHGTSWEDAIGFGLRRLTTVRNAHPDPYYYGISRYNPDNIHPIHKAFWSFFDSFDAKSIITLNYDLLAEQALHMVGNDGNTRPRFAYGGFPYRQVVRKMTNVTTRTYEDVFLGVEYLIYKLHGSLNWAHERHSENLKIHDDVRAVFRTSDQIGVPAIVPPIPEKELLEEFSRIWSQAASELENSKVWIVCGYSMPEYDQELRDWFKRIMLISNVRRIAVLDPNSEILVSRWHQDDRPDVEVRGFPGLPDCLSDELQRFIIGT